VALELCVVVFLILLNGVLAGAEIAIVSVERTRLVQLVEEGVPGARAVGELRKNPERFFAAVQIGITLVGATAAAFSASRFARPLEPLIASVAFLEPIAPELSFATVVVAISFLSVVFGELVPKSLALRYKEIFARATGPLILALSWTARPLVWLFSSVSQLALRLFAAQANPSEPGKSPEELQLIVSEATENGSIHPASGEIASRALDFAELTAADVMVPRGSVIGIPHSSRPDDIRRIVTEYPYSRFPVHRETLDEVVGYVLVKDLLTMAFERQLIVLGDVLRAPYTVEKAIRAPELLHEMRRRRVHLAFVRDGHGGIAGIVTMEDLLEELVGEIFSEVAQDFANIIRELPDGTAVAHAATPIREVNRRLGLELPESDEWSTLGGLCSSLAGRIPEQGERLTSPDGTMIEIQAATDRRVLRVMLRPPETAGDGAAG
jgi:putative hemolysin